MTAAGLGRVASSGLISACSGLISCDIGGTGLVSGYHAVDLIGSQKQQRRLALSEQDPVYQWRERETVQGAVEQGLYQTLNPPFGLCLNSSSRLNHYFQEAQLPIR
eukprot:maker-scaffold911_size81771-snap-gene-0.19 protein:Tk03751 transcript:maker-scaffold911_size81771-snap-gene-0.19-mRNA-1 annotation:"asparagine synthase"